MAGRDLPILAALDLRRRPISFPPASLHLLLGHQLRLQPTFRGLHWLLDLRVGCLAGQPENSTNSPLPAETRATCLWRDNFLRFIARIDAFGEIRIQDEYAPLPSHPPKLCRVFVHNVRNVSVVVPIEDDTISHIRQVRQ